MRRPWKLLNLDSKPIFLNIRTCMIAANTLNTCTAPFPSTSAELRRFINIIIIIIIIPVALRSSVVGGGLKYEQSKKSVIRELFSEIGVYLVKEGSYRT